MIFAFPSDERRILESTPEEREAALEEHGFSACRIWTDTATDLDANEMAVELFREMVRRTIDDPDLAESLSPRGYPLGCKRPVLDSNYFETFNRDNVTLVDLRKDPIEEVTPTGIRTEHRLRGARRARARHRLRRHDRRAHAHRRARAAAVACLRDDWADGPRTYLGVGTEGYPNLFICVGPGSPGVLATYPPQIELQVGWIADFIGHLVEHGYTRAEADPTRRTSGATHVNEVAQGTMFTAASCNSWYNGANIEGKPRVFLPYVGGLPKYMAAATTSPRTATTASCSADGRRTARRQGAARDRRRPVAGRGDRRGVRRLRVRRSSPPTSPAPTTARCAATTSPTPTTGPASSTTPSPRTVVSTGS